MTNRPPLDPGSHSGRVSFQDRSDGLGRSGTITGQPSHQVPPSTRGESMGKKYRGVLVSNVVVLVVAVPRVSPQK